MSEDHNAELYSEKSESEESEHEVDEDESLERREESQKQIDRMTLELLVHKSQYRKYLEKNEPAEYEKKTGEIRTFFEIARPHWRSHQGIAK